MLILIAIFVTYKIVRSNRKKSPAYSRFIYSNINKQNSDEHLNELNEHLKKRPAEIEVLIKKSSIYNDILHEAISKLIYSYSNGEIRFYKEAELQSYLYKCCVESFEKRNIPKPHKIFLEKRIMGKFVDFFHEFSIKIALW